MNLPLSLLPVNASATSAPAAGFFVLASLLLFLFWVVQGLWRRGARKRLLATVKAMALGGRTEIDGQPVEHWLGVLNRASPYPIIAYETVVLVFKGRELFFLFGAIPYTIPSADHYSYQTENGLFLVAVGQPAVRLLSEHQHVFRHISGSTELAAFSIFRWQEFLEC